MGDGACEGCVPEGRVWAMGTPPGTMPSNAPGMPPGATPTTPGGYLRKKQDDQVTVATSIKTTFLFYCSFLPQRLVLFAAFHTVRITNLGVLLYIQYQNM